MDALGVPCAAAQAPYREGMARTRSRVTIVLFDVDGTLIDSNDAHARSWVATLADYPGVTFSRVRPLIGKGGDKVLPELTGLSSDSVVGRALLARREALFREELPRLAAFPGARALLARLRMRDQRPVVVSSARGDELQGLLAQARLSDLFEDTGAAEEAEHSKPDPDIVAVALQRAGAAPAEAVLIGDTPYDIAAARSAGVRAIALRCGGHWRDEDLAGAVALYNDPEDLLQRLSGSVLD